MESLEAKAASVNAGPTPHGARPLIVVDLSRLVYAAAFSRTPSGIPRVELAYAEYFLAHHLERLRFVVVDALGRFRLVDHQLAITFIRRISAYWHSTVQSPSAYLRLAASAHALHAWLLVRPGASFNRLAARSKCIYVIPSQLHLERAAAIKQLKSTGNLKLVYVVHDIIPTLLPEYFPPDAQARNQRRMETAAQQADLIVANSHATARAFASRFGKDLQAGRLVAAPIGVNARPSPSVQLASDCPYFVSIGTLEPRKNHLLLLKTWRSLQEQLGDATPRLILIGERGWENENAVDMLERSVALKGIVEERQRASDEEVTGLLQGARALLLPSFAEGFGMPLAEGLAAQVPAICSDIPAFREVGGEVPDYLDPLDGPAWRTAILDYSDPSSAGRMAQLQRMTRWTKPTWEKHFAIVQSALDTLERQMTQKETAE